MITAAIERGALYVLSFALTGAILAALWFAHARDTEQTAHARTSLDLSNARAAAETTRVRFADSLVRIVDRAAIQTAQTPDAVDRQLRQTRTALDSIRAAIVALRVTVRSTASVTSSGGAAGDSVRRAAFDVREAPYTAHADVSLPARGAGTLALRVELDTIPLTVRPSCGDADANGIRPARVSVSAPAWASISLARVEQSADVCRSPALERASAIDAAAHDRRTRLAIVAGYGFTAGGAAGWTAVQPRVFVGLGIAKPLPLPRWLPFH